MTPKEEQFVKEYTIDWNGAAAARRAGYSAGSARQIAYEMLTKPYIKEAIKERIAELAMEQDEILARFGDMARGRIPTKVTKLPSGSIKEEFDSQGALEKLGRAHALFTDKHQVNVFDGLEVIDDE